MGLCYLYIPALFSVLSFAGLQFWTEYYKYGKLQEDGLFGHYSIYSRDADTALELLLGSYATIAFLAIFAFSVFTLLILCLKTIFFGELNVLEIRKLVEHLFNYVIYKGIFFPLIVPPTKVQLGLWSTWLILLCSLKTFQTLARDRLERLNASPSTTTWTYSRVFSVLPFILAVDLLWMKVCWEIREEVGSSMSVLLFFEPFGILFETLQAIVVHGFQLLDIRLHHSGSGEIFLGSKYFDFSGSLLEWKGVLLRNLGFFLDVLTLLMALGHYAHIWWLHGMGFHLVDLFLLLNIRTLFCAIVKRVRGFIRLRMDLCILHSAIPDATSEELQIFDDECAICREPLAKAKKLSCNHLFHLACLRSWLDQGLSDMYSCPTCRKPLFARPGEVNRLTNDEQIAHQISSGLNQQTASGQIGVFPNLSRAPLESTSWRGGVDSRWLNPGVDGAGPSSGEGSGGFGRVQTMMRHLAAVGETYAQTALRDTSWSLWPLNPPRQPAPSTSVHSASNDSVLQTPDSSLFADRSIASFLAMAETVREVLPHIPDDLIFQELQRTNSVSVTVNNLLQM